MSRVTFDPPLEDLDSGDYTERTVAHECGCSTTTAFLVFGGVIRSSELWPTAMRPVDGVRSTEVRKCQAHRPAVAE